MAFDLPTAWTEATAVVAAVYGVPLDELRAPSRGRGPKPRAELIEPRKVALYVALCLSGVDYATIGRHVGLTRDTVSTHAAFVRASDDLDETVSTVMGLIRENGRLRERPEQARTHARRDQAARAAAARRRDVMKRLEAMLDGASDEPSDGAHPVRSSDIVRQAVTPSREAA